MLYLSGTLFVQTIARRLAVILCYPISFVLAGLLPLSAGLEGLIHVKGPWQHGLRPGVYVYAQDNRYAGTVQLERGLEKTNLFWIKLTGSNTCRITLEGLEGEIVGSARVLANQTNLIPETITVRSEYKGVPVQHVKIDRMLRLWDLGEYQVQRFQIKNIRVPQHNPTGYITVELVLYEAGKGDTHARLIRFLPLKVQLPPFKPSPSPTTPTLAPASSPYPVDPNWANPDRVAALADLPAPSASWLPWAAWGTAAAALVAAGLLYRCRRRAASREKSGN